MNTNLSKKRRGSIMINSLLIAFFLVMTGTAFMMWAVDESFQAKFDLARSQAYYVAQHGILKRVLTSMRNRRPETLPAGTEYLQGGEMYDPVTEERIGEYSDVTLTRVRDYFVQGIFASKFYYDMSAVGTVQVMGPHGRVEEISRKVTMRTQLRTYASYMYLTNEEQTMFNEIIWFWTPDTLYGRVHSNSTIGIKFAPQFHGPVSSTEDDFEEFAASPWFAFEPQFNAPRVYFPSTAENLRAGAAGGGTFFHNNGGNWRSRLEARQGGWHLWQWEQGVPFDCTAVENEADISWGSNLAVFIEGDVELWGDWVTGACTVGCSGLMELLDNVTYSGVNPGGYVSPMQPLPETQHILGLVSEGNIRIKDTWVNGRGNGAAEGAWGNHDRKHIVITAAMVALGESFTFEHQNDFWNTYYWCDPNGDNANTPDERGTIWLRGAVTQMRRGYVHRSNCGGTGYAKDYLYDFRLESIPPPFYLEAVDEGGSSLFDVVYWKEEMEE